MTDTNNLDTFRHNNRVYSISITIDPKKFRKLCQERNWLDGCFKRTYEEALQMVDACHSIGDLMILANHIEQNSYSAKHASCVAEWILSDCCHFMVYEMELLPKNLQRKLKICHLLERFKK